MRTRQIARPIATLLLATALVISGCKSPLHNHDLMVDKPSKTPVVLRDAQEEVKDGRRASDILPVPQKKEEVKKETKKEKIEKTPEGEIMTTSSGVKILIKKEGGIEILERPRKKPIDLERIH